MFAEVSEAEIQGREARSKHGLHTFLTAWRSPVRNPVAMARGSAKPMRQRQGVHDDGDS